MVLSDFLQRAKRLWECLTHTLAKPKHLIVVPLPSHSSFRRPNEAAALLWTIDSQTFTRIDLMSSLSGSITSRPERLYFWVLQPWCCSGCRASALFDFFHSSAKTFLCLCTVCKSAIHFSDGLNGAAAAAHPHILLCKGTFSTLFRHDGVHLLSSCSFLQLDSSISIFRLLIFSDFHLALRVGREPARLGERRRGEKGGRNGRVIRSQAPSQGFVGFCLTASTVRVEISASVSFHEVSSGTDCWWLCTSLLQSSQCFDWREPHCCLSSAWQVALDSLTFFSSCCELQVDFKGVDSKSLNANYCWINSS